MGRQTYWVSDLWGVWFKRVVGVGLVNFRFEPEEAMEFFWGGMKGPSPTFGNFLCGRGTKDVSAIIVMWPPGAMWHTFEKCCPLQVPETWFRAIWWSKNPRAKKWILAHLSMYVNLARCDIWQYFPCLWPPGFLPPGFLLLGFLPYTCTSSCTAEYPRKGPKSSRIIQGHRAKPLCICTKCLTNNVNNYWGLAYMHVLDTSTTMD